MIETNRIELELEENFSAEEIDASILAIKAKYNTENIKLKKSKTQMFDKNIEEIKNNIPSLYRTYLLEQGYDEKTINDFLTLDEKISKEITSNTTEITKNFKVLSVESKNILSFQNLSVNLDDQGVVKIMSVPQNMGGKSNLIRTIKLMLFGEFYRSGGKSTLKNILHKHSPLTFGYIKGEISIDGEIYKILREYRKTTSNVTQKVTITKNDVLFDNKLFENLIGDIKDFYFTSYFDANNVEKWIVSKPTERYNLFVKYFGLKNFDEKKEIAKKQLGLFLKNSKIETNSIESVSTQISNNLNEISLNESAQAELINNKELLTVSIKQISDQISRKENLLKGVPDSILNHSQSTLEAQREDIAKKIEEKSKQILELEGGFIDIDINDINRHIDTIQQEISNVSPSTELKNKLDILNNMKQNINVPYNLSSKKNQIEQDILNKRQEYTLLGLTVKQLSSNIEDNQCVVCPNCNHEINNEEKNKKIQSQIDECLNKQEKIKNEGLSLKDDLTEIETEILNFKINENKKISSQIDEVEKLITNEKLEKISEFKRQLLHYDELRNSYNKNKTDKHLHAEYKDRLHDLKQKFEENEILLKNYKIYKEDKDFNSKIKDEIQELHLLKNTIEKELQDLEVKYQLLSHSKNALVENSNNLNNLLEIVKVELIQKNNYDLYIKTHSKGGIAIFLLQALLQIINKELSIILNHYDFRPFIRIEEDSIEFLFERDEIEYDMNEGSGLEMTSMSLALHCILLDKMKIPISNILILDEVFSAVGDENLEKTGDLIKEINNIFPTILLISHNTQINWNTNKITITKNNNISKII